MLVLECSWDYDAVDRLPEYKQLYYKSLLDVYDEIGNDMAERGTSFHLNYGIEAVSLRRSIHI